MKSLHLWSALAILAVWPILASAADLSKIDRTIRKQPAYQSEPKYCLVLFGPEAKTRIWLVRDGETLYVDKNGNGDLTEAGERVPLARNDPNLNSTNRRGGTLLPFHIGEIMEADGKTRHTGWKVYAFGDIMSMEVEMAGGILWHVGHHSGYPWWGEFRFADKPQDAPIVHFNGPKTFSLNPYQQFIGRKELFVEFGTPGLGKGTFAKMRLSKDSHPVAESELPHKTPGQGPIKVTTILKGRA